MNFPPKPLGFVKQGIAEMGNELSYVYEDLIFPDNTAYLIQFGKENYELNIYINTECPDKDLGPLKHALTRAFAGSVGFSLNFPSRFTLTPNEETEEMEIAFVD